jgi:hypothetical protein
MKAPKHEKISFMVNEGGGGVMMKDKCVYVI